MSKRRKKAGKTALGSKIFISYATQDRPLATRITSALKAAGREVWLDAEDISYAEAWTDVVLPVIERTPAFLFLTSRQTVASQHCLEELAHAASLGKRIIPRKAEPVTEALPEILKPMVRWDFRDSLQFDEPFNAIGSPPRPYGQFGLLPGPCCGLQVAGGGAFNVFDYVYRANQKSDYSMGQAGFSARN